MRWRPLVTAGVCTLFVGGECCNEPEYKALSLEWVPTFQQVRFSESVDHSEREGRLDAITATSVIDRLRIVLHRFN